MRDPAGEERVRGGGLLVHVRVEVVAGERGERLDVVQRDLARAGDELVADLQLGEALAERVLAARSPTSAPACQTPVSAVSMSGEPWIAVRRMWCSTARMPPSSSPPPARPGPPCTRCGIGEPWPVEERASSRSSSSTRPL